MGKSNKGRTHCSYLTDKLWDELEKELDTRPRDLSMSKLIEELLWKGLGKDKTDK